MFSVRIREGCAPGQKNQIGEDAAFISNIQILVAYTCPLPNSVTQEPCTHYYVLQFHRVGCPRFNEFPKNATLVGVWGNVRTK